MLYFSELEGAQVYSNNQKYLGTLDDLLFTIVGGPYITKLVVKSSKSSSSFFNIFKNDEGIFIPVEYLVKLTGGKVIVNENFEESKIDENELFIKKNLMDTQVIDIEENNIVRVNDVVIQTINSQSIIYGVDIGISGILRQLRIEKFFNNLLRFFGRYYIPQSILAWSDIQPLELTRGRVVVKSRFNSLKKLHPADVADYLETQNFKNVMALIGGIDKEYLAKVISELNPNFQVALFKIMPTDKIIPIISLMDPDDAADIISQFSHKKQELILSKLDSDQSSIIRQLLKLVESPLGDFLVPEFLTVYPEQSVYDVMKKVQDRTADYAILQYVYVVNKDNHLIGVFDLHELLLQRSDTPVFRFMRQKVISVNLHTPAEVAFRRMIKYGVESLPIIDNERRIIGIISIKDLSKEILEKIE